MTLQNGRLVQLLGWALIVLHLGVLTYLVTEVPIGADERVYLLAGRSLLEGTDWSVREELFQGPIPLWANQIFAGDLSDLDAGTIRARYGMLPFSLILLVVLRGFASEAYGRKAGLLATVLAAFSPALLAWGPQLTVDTSLTAFLTLSWWLLWRWLQKPTPVRLLGFGAALGLAFATKYAALVLSLGIPLIVIAACLRGFDPLGAAPGSSENEVQDGRVRGLWPRLLWSGGFLVGALAIAVFVLHAAYGFRAPRFEAEDFEYLSGLIGGVAKIPGAELGFELLPRPFLEGIDYQASVSKELAGTFGTLRKSHWAYYPMSLVTKLPLGTMALVLASLLFARSRHGTRGTEFVWSIPALVFLGYMSFANNLQGGLRYLLPVLPLLHLRASALASAEIRNPAFRRVRSGFVGVAVGFVIVSTAGAAPHFTGYFNEAVGGPVGGMRWFGGQNCDWLGQYRERGRAELGEQDSSLVFLEETSGARFGRVAAYVSDLKRPDRLDDSRTYHWLDRFEPVDHYAAAWFVYEVSADDFAAARDAGDRRADLDLAVAEARNGDFGAARQALAQARDSEFADAAESLRVALGSLEAGASDPTLAIVAATQLASLGEADLVVPLLDRSSEIPAELRFQVLYQSGAQIEALQFARRTVAERPLTPVETLTFASGLYWRSKVLEADALMSSQEPPPEESPLRQKWDELRAEIARVADSRRRMNSSRSSPDSPSTAPRDVQRDVDQQDG